MKSKKTSLPILISVMLSSQMVGCFSIENTRRQARESATEVNSLTEEAYKSQIGDYRTELGKWIEAYYQSQKDRYKAERKLEIAKLRLEVNNAIEEERLALRKSMIETFEAAVDSALVSIKDQLRAEQEALINGSGSESGARDLALKLSVSLAVMHKNTEEIGARIDQEFALLKVELATNIDEKFPDEDLDTMTIDSGGSITVRDYVERYKDKAKLETDLDHAITEGFEAIDAYVDRDSDFKTLLQGALGPLANPTTALDTIFNEARTQLTSRVNKEIDQLGKKADEVSGSLFKEIKDKAEAFSNGLLEKGIKDGA